VSANVPRILIEEGRHGDCTWVIEQGAVGGVPLLDFQFGCASNAEAIVSSPYQFTYFQGGGFDASLLSFLQIDRSGSVNVSKLSAKPHVTAGAGGFVDITARAKKIVFSGFFNAGASFPKEKLGHSLYPLLRGLTHGCSLLIHKSHFERVGLFDEKLRTTGDYDLWFRIFRGTKLMYHDGVLIKNRCHAAQQVNCSPTHVGECNRLWSSMVDRLTSTEMREMASSEYQFYRSTAEFLKSTPFTEAQKHVQGLADNIREKISVIIPFYNRIPVVVQAVKSVLNQTYEHFEILLIDDGSTDPATAIL
jgi:hypothetical protein